jgi:hypothetical protein
LKEREREREERKEGKKEGRKEGKVMFGVGWGGECYIKLQV